MTPSTTGDSADDPRTDTETGADPARSATGEDSSVDWDGLPDPLRHRIAEVAASAVGEMRPGDVPGRVRPVMRFAAAKRAKLGHAELLAAMGESAVFRAAVLDWCRRKRPEVLEVRQRDPLAAATANVLLNTVNATHYVELIDRRTREDRTGEERDSALARAEKLASENERLRRELTEAAESVERAREHSGKDVDRLRKRLQQKGVQLKECRTEVERLGAELERLARSKDREIAELTAERDRERNRAREERARAERASNEAETARQSAREARKGDEVRLELLLDTLEGSIAGLRREIGSTSGGGPRSGPKPAETVSRVRAGAAAVEDVPDVAVLNRLLALPAVHVIIDGYNVTKTGYPDLPLAEQRERLSQQAAVLAARSGVEVTVVFDGANVVSVPNAGPRGVRVLFSEPGVQADDLIRDLVDAEPVGRQLVVATSDREVVESVRRRGAYTVASAVLLERISPG
ncbi:NYN domain-containing protein [Actinopolyspora mortivallis]|uniref:NYN domain-containing protein n=1 Tax=Actinopolyspora mortivallis TaxID=33906 RepID=UPI00037A06A1|nr:NYN domain-containing protein [Actinopolyspora mortivallis]